ncbi:MAG TPA: ABC transporter permease, partial [Thermococcaceae archaeon]|nr:ABC transporter permease [Thermococcaceae archaeon]
MISVLYQNEVYRLLKSRRFKVMLVLMLLPVVIYFFTHEEITEYSAKALKISFQINISQFLINFWASVIG